jgi:pimeloyl-ACP methyl ester carboxylesterase
MIGRRSSIRLQALAAVLIAVSTACGATVDDVVSEGRQIRLLVRSPVEPVAVAVLFAGGHGALDIDEDGRIGWGRGNFLVRSGYLFRNSGFVTAIIDAPAERMSRGLYHFRDSAEHAADVIRHLRDRFALPVVLVGTSRGTESVANAAARLRERDGPAAIVLSATVLVPNDGGRHVLAMDLESIRVPTFIVHHRRDECSVTPFARVDELRARLTRAKPVAVLAFEGGIAQGDACRARHYHGFKGIEARVVGEIVRWLETHALGR